VLRSFLALAGFIAGAALSTFIGGKADNIRGRDGFLMRAMAVEAALLGAFAVLWILPASTSQHIMLRILVAIAGIGMGLQSAVVKRLNLPGVVTTYITGTLTSLVTSVSSRLRGHNLTSAAVSTPSEISPRSVRLQAQVFITYGLAALLSGALYNRWSAGAGFLPVVAILLTGASLMVSHAEAKS
jgi:uncharacterized membrane protein YoaK (UPF0700 family)